MKKILKKIGKFLINIALMFSMLTGAQHAMNLPLGWADRSRPLPGELSFQE